MSADISKREYIYLSQDFVDAINVEREKWFKPAQYTEGAQALFDAVQEVKELLAKKEISREQAFKKVADVERTYDLPAFIKADRDYNFDLSGHISAIQSELCSIEYRHVHTLNNLDTSSTEAGNLAYAKGQQKAQVWEHVTF